MSPPRSEFSSWSQRSARWLLPAALLALTPKCVLCLLAYVGLGAALGLNGPELCGAPADSPVSWATLLAWLGVAGALSSFAFLVNCRRGDCVSQLSGASAGSAHPYAAETSVSTAVCRRLSSRDPANALSEKFSEIRIFVRSRAVAENCADDARFLFQTCPSQQRITRFE
jgi:hypothetical protein